MVEVERHRIDFTIVALRPSFTCRGRIRPDRRREAQDPKRQFKHKVIPRSEHSELLLGSRVLLAFLKLFLVEIVLDALRPLGLIKVTQLPLVEIELKRKNNNRRNEPDLEPVDVVLEDVAAFLCEVSGSLLQHGITHIQINFFKKIWKNEIK